MTKHLTSVDLFCGAGLMAEGFRRAGFRPLLAIDVDRYAIASYTRNVARVARLGSVLDINGAPKCDVLIAGPPCQGFSTLGRRDPTDYRNDLSLVVAEWAHITRAAVVVVENVPPFLDSRQWRSLTRRLKRLGYVVDAWVLDAQDYGVAQRRRRSFTVASKIGMPPPPRRRSARLVVREAFAGLDRRTRVVSQRVV
jgi:DNA (cytosine-5)-methyltransferase 1